MLIQQCETDQSALIYADVFPSSLIHPTLQKQTKLYDDGVDYAEVNHNLSSATHTTVNSEVGKYNYF